MIIYFTKLSNVPDQISSPVPSVCNDILSGSLSMLLEDEVG
jgi:hypothetical protein